MLMGWSYRAGAQGSFRNRMAGRFAGPFAKVPRTAATVLSVVVPIACALTVVSCGGDSGTAPGIKGTARVATIGFDRSIDSVEVQRTSTITPSFFDATGSPTTPTSTMWTTGDTTVATVSSAGVVTGKRVGTTYVVLNAGGPSLSLPVVVLPPAVATITFATTSFTLTEGDTLTIPAPHVVDRTGAVVSGRMPTYSSSASNVTVSATGLVTAVAAGSATVTATIDTAHTSLTFTVLPAQIGQVKLIPSAIFTGIGNIVSTQASAFSLAGQQLQSRTYSYRILNPSVATVSQTGVVSGVGSGTTTMVVTTGTGSVSVPISVAALRVAGFVIDLRFVGNVPATVRAAAAQAAARWEQTISAPLIPYHIIVGADTCGKGIPAVDTTETNMMIIVQADSIDGRANIVGEGGPCVIRDDSPQLTALGTLTIDTADVAGLSQQGLLVATITHEMGHILGIGTLWDETSYASLVSGLGGANPVFTGHAARVASAELGFTADSSLGVPIENTGKVGDGTRDSHWRASVFGHELMTGSIHSGLNPLSLVTIDALGDFGYPVVQEAADNFNVANATSPGTPVRPSATISSELREGLRFPQFTTSRTGKLKPIPGARPPTMQ